GGAGTSVNAGKLLLNAGYKGFFARASLDASVQYGITGDIDLISATASGVGFGRYGIMANVGAAGIDYTLIGGQYRDVFSNKLFSDGMYDMLGSFGPNLGRSISSPRNSLGTFGIEATGNTLGTLVSEMLK
ncbi:MAG: hypothetical protein LAT51_05765, partial [Flavobacteriaceae bacterium]|nr:hypothetical protein [Flavobacteriaceae bacterium]